MKSMVGRMSLGISKMPESLQIWKDGGNGRYRSGSGEWKSHSSEILLVKMRPFFGDKATEKVHPSNIGLQCN